MSFDILNRWTNAIIFHSEKAENLSEAVQDANLRGANLSDADLSYANLRSADLRSANLRGANLSYANLSYANLSYANLSYANLRSADLSYANLRSADLRSANLRGANLSYANLSDADLRSADLNILRITGTRHPIIVIDDSNISIGCMRNPLTWWYEHYKAVGRTEGYSTVQVEEYRMHLEYAERWLSHIKASTPKL